MCTDKQVFLTHRSVGLVVVLLGSPRAAYTWLHTCIEFRFISCGNSSFWDQLLPGIFSSHDYGKTCKWPSPQNKAYGTNSGIWNALHSYLFIPPPLFSPMLPYSSQIGDFCPWSSMIHLWPYCYVLLFAFIHRDKSYTSCIPQINPKISSHAFGLLNWYRSIYLNCLFRD